MATNYWIEKSLSEGLAGLVKIARVDDRTCDGCGARRVGYTGNYRGAYFEVTGEGTGRTLCEGCALPYDERDGWTVTMIPTYAQARAAQRWEGQGIGAD